MTSRGQSPSPIEVKKIEIHKKSLPVNRESAEALLKSRKVFSLTPELLKDGSKTLEPIVSGNAKQQNFFAEESQDLMSSAVQNFLKLPEKPELWSDLENTMSPGNQLKGTCLPSDVEKDVTESVGSPKGDRKRPFHLKMKRKLSDESVASPDLKVLMRRGEKEASFSMFNLEDEDGRKLDLTMHRDLNEMDKIESATSTRNLSHFAQNNTKKPIATGDSLVNEQISDLKNVQTINPKKVVPFERSNTQKDLANLAKKKNWNKLSHVFQSVLFFQHEEAKEVKDAELISDEINEFRLRKVTTIGKNGKRNMNITKDDMTREAFDAMRTIRIFCDCAAIGGPKHVQIMAHMIKNDPRKFVFDHEDPYHLLNRINDSGHRPLYIAAKHGNLEVVKLLVENKVNCALTSRLSDSAKIEETAVEAAVRWGHIQVVEYLLKNCVYSSTVLQRCFNLTKNDSIRLVIKHCGKFKENKKSLFSFLGCLKIE